MKGRLTLFYLFSAAICFSVQAQKPGMDTNAVKSLLNRVADFQVNTPLTHTETDWTNGALYAGMAEWALLTNNNQLLGWLKDIGERNSWTYLHRSDPKGRYHADDYCVGQMYLELYRKYGDQRMKQPMQDYLDQIIAHPSEVGFEFVNTDSVWATERWTWCDALFMGPTVWAKMANITGNKKYLDFMFKEYKATTDFLYDTNYHLYYRDSRFKTQKEANGLPVFWGRGNGWVFAGLPVIMRELPADYENRIYFENLFKAMAAEIISLQDPKGYWHASLLDPASYPNPEMSATSFFVYGLAWGINNHYLDKKTYLPAVLKGWQFMTTAVTPEGMVGWIQPIGYDPRSVTAEMTEVYGVGAFLLAGSEIYRMLLSE